MDYFIVILLSYFTGSIPTAYIFCRIILKQDIRQLGSGNVGTTNAFRILGKKIGILTLIIDCMKGLIPVILTKYYFPDNVNMQISSGLAAVLGHIFTIFLKFKGGKGVATSAGFLIALTPAATFFSIVVFVSVLIKSKYVSLSSVMAAFTYPLFVAAVGIRNRQILVLSVILALIIILKHRTNIKRLIEGTENSISKK